MLYERSKLSGSLPVGALPFLAGAVFPAAGIAIPALLYIRSVANKRAIQAEEEAFEVFCRQKEIARLVMPQVHKELDNISLVMGELATARLDKKDYRSEADRLAAIKKEEQNVRQLGIQLEGLTNSFAHHMSIVS